MTFINYGENKAEYSILAHSRPGVRSERQFRQLSDIDRMKKGPEWTQGLYSLKKIFI